MNYKDYKENRQNEFNALPIFYAFSNDQFEKAITERGLTMDNIKGNVYRFGDTGGFYLKSDAPIIHDYFKKDRDKELRDIMNSDADFARDAFVYEMYNHEYPINWQGDWDVASCFGNVEYDENKNGANYLEEMGYNDSVIAQWYSARKEVISANQW